MEKETSLLEIMNSEINLNECVDISSQDELATSVFRDVSSEAFATKAGIQTNSLQAAIDNYPKAMNQSAIAKSTGLPVKTPTQQYKGFATEEYLKNTLKINALAKGHADYSIGIYTKGEMPDGTVLSGIDMETDIAVFVRKNPWSKPMRTANYQSKMHNNAKDYAKDMQNPQYKNMEFVGGKGQGVNDKVRVQMGKDVVESDAITAEEAAKLAEEMKNQATPDYSKKAEKFDELNKVNFNRAVIAGATTGLILSAVQEVVSVIKNANDLPEDQFIKSIEHIMCGTIEGGARGGAIYGSVQLMGKLLGREVAANSIEAIPAMAMANVAVDFAKDLYQCFVTEKIDIDDLLCNSVNNLYSSVAGFGGAWVAGQLGGQIAGQFSSQAVIQGVEFVASAKASAATGAAIGSSLGPIGTVVGSVVGGIVIGLGVNAIIGVANKDAQEAYCKSVEEINSNIELSGCEKLYYFADTMGSLSDFRLSFKNLLPAYNLISDLKEYNLHKKAMKSISDEMEAGLGKIDQEKERVIRKIERQHRKDIDKLKKIFAEQNLIIRDKYRESVNTYVANAYMQYIDIYPVLEGNAKKLVQELEERKVEHNYIIEYMRHRNAVNSMLNDLLHDLIEDDNIKQLKPLLDKIQWFMMQDSLLVGRQYISSDEAILLVNGGADR